MQVLDKKQAQAVVSAQTALLDRAAAQNPFTSAVWTEHFLAQTAQDYWSIAAIQSASPQYLALMYFEAGKPHALQALSNYYASLYTPINSTSDRRQSLSEDLVRQISMARPKVATVNLSPLELESADTMALQRAFAKQGWYVRQYSCFGNWYLPCEGMTFADYMAARDSRTRNTWKRKAKKFTNSNNADGARLQIVTQLDEVDAAMDAYDRIYANSWKKPEPYPDFVRGWAKCCARKGTLRLGLAWLGDIPIAAQFWFTENRRAFIYKLAYDEEHKKWSAGTVLSAKLFELSLDQDKVVEIDYLTGDDPYKQAWMSHRRERIGLIACNPRTLRGLLAGFRERAGVLWQQWCRRNA